jgi:hypothetical protein
MVEYSLHASTDSEGAKRYAKRNGLTKRATAIEYALDTEKPDNIALE